MNSEDEDRRTVDELLRRVRREAPPADLEERVLEQIAFRGRLLQSAEQPWNISRAAVIFSSLALAASAALLVMARNAARELPIRAESVAGAPRAAISSARLPTALPSPASVPDPCREHATAEGRSPLIDDFEDGDDAIRPLEGRSGFWRWAREIDAPGTAPALLPVPRPEATRANRLAQHVKGAELVDWGATLEFDFRPSCYDASRYAGVSFQARGPGRIYVTPREVSVIPVAEGGSCERDCYNGHQIKIDLDATFRTYQVRWSDVRQRGFGKPPLDPRRLHSLAFLIRPEDTPYDVWLDDVRFLQP